MHPRWALPSRKTAQRSLPRDTLCVPELPGFLKDRKPATADLHEASPTPTTTSDNTEVKSAKSNRAFASDTTLALGCRLACLAIGPSATARCFRNPEQPGSLAPSTSPTDDGTTHTPSQHHHIRSTYLGCECDGCECS